MPEPETTQPDPPPPVEADAPGRTAAPAETAPSGQASGGVVAVSVPSAAGPAQAEENSGGGGNAGDDSGGNSGGDVGGGKQRIVLCPYCGHTQPQGTSRCEACGGLFEPLSRRATQIAMGPWYIRDKQNPFRPGSSYEVLVKMIESGRVVPTTVLRGPTTRQFWSIARNVPGVAHLLGYCHACAKHVDPKDPHCPHCGVAFGPVKHRNELGLQFPTRRSAAAAQRSLNRLLGVTPTEDDTESPTTAAENGAAETVENDAELAAAAANHDATTGETPTSVFEQEAASRPAPAAAPGGDLIDDVLGEEVRAAATTPAPPTPDAPAEARPESPLTAPAPGIAPAPVPGSSPAPPVSALAQDRRPINWTVVLLVALNVLVAVLLLVVFVLRDANA